MAVEPAGPPTTTPTSVLSVGRVRPTSKPKLNHIARPGSLSPLSSPSPLSGPSSFSPPSKEPTPKGRLAPLAKQPTTTTVVPALRTGVAPQRPCVGLSGLKERAALRQQGSVHTSCGDLGATLRRSTLPATANPTPAAPKPEWPPTNSEEEAPMQTSFEKFIEEALPGSDARPSTAPTRTDSCKGLPLSLELVRGGQANQFVETQGEGVSLLMSMAGPDSLFGPGNGAGIGLLMQTAGHSHGQTNTNTQDNEGGSLSRSPDEAIMKDNCGISGSQSGFWASFQEPTEVKQTTEDALDRLFEQRGGPPSARREAGGVAPLEGGFSMLLQCKQEAQEIISARGKDTSGLFQSLSILSEA